MKKPGIFLFALCAFLTVVAAVTAIIIFRNEIVLILSDIKDKVEEKGLFRRNGEFADYADV